MSRCSVSLVGMLILSFLDNRLVIMDETAMAKLLNHGHVEPCTYVIFTLFYVKLNGVTFADS